MEELEFNEEFDSDDEYDRWVDSAFDSVFCSLNVLRDEGKLNYCSIDQLRCEEVSRERSWFFNRTDRFDQLVTLWSKE